MANNLTDQAERLVLDWLNGVAVQQPAAPLLLRLMTANGSESAAGTQVTGDTYEAQEIGFAAAATVSGASSMKNAATITFPSLDTTTAKSIVGIEIWDSAQLRIAWHTFTAVNVPAGQPAVWDPNTLSLSLE